MRSHAFGSRRHSRPSLSSVSVRHSSAPSIGRSSQSASRPATKAGSTSSISGTIPPRRQVVYMDAPNPCSDFIWNGCELKDRPSTSSTVRPASKAMSVLTNPEGTFDITLKVLPEVEVGLGDLPGYTKVPLYVPRRIERSQVAHTTDQGCEDTPKFLLHPTPKPYGPANSDISFASLRGQTSIRSQIERETMIRAAESDNGMRSYPSSRGRLLSRALSGVWPDKAVQLSQKRYKRRGL